MTDQECVEFLQWALPELRLRWQGFRQVRGQVCKRIGSRLRQLGLSRIEQYRAYIESCDAEWLVLENLCHITISRFYRDAEMFRALEHEVAPKLATAAAESGEKMLQLWCAGCASGEEAYTLNILWRLAVKRLMPRLKIRIVATDANYDVLKRANAGCYRFGSFKELPDEWLEKAFTQSGDLYCVRPEYRNNILFQHQDIRAEMPEGRFHLIFCRNLVFTYFEPPQQKEVARQLADKLFPGGVLVIGVEETLPANIKGLHPWPGAAGIYQSV